MNYSIGIGQDPFWKPYYFSYCSYGGGSASPWIYDFIYFESAHNINKRYGPDYPSDCVTSLCFWLGAEGDRE